jgi:transcriptional regulator with XRE-family HTH domain
MLGDWERKADEMEEKLPKVGRFPAAGLVRRARRINDMSQRQMAVMAGVSPSTVGRVESGAIRPTLDLLQRLLATTGLYLVVVDQDGRVIHPMRECEETRDGAGRRYPSHLDTILDPLPGEWWADEFGLARPPETFYRNRRHRDEMRARSQWEVRAKMLRHAPPPPRPGERQAREEYINQINERRRLGIFIPSEISSDEFDGFE